MSAWHVPVLSINVLEWSDRVDICNTDTKTLEILFQWREASYTRSDGDVVRVYTVCNVAVTAVDNWLRTPLIASHQANRLYVDIDFSMRKCTKYPNPGRLQQCKVDANLQTQYSGVVLFFLPTFSQLNVSFTVK